MRSSQVLLFIAILLVACNRDHDEPTQPSDGGNTTSCPGTTVTDIDGNAYPIVRIGNQCWMAANLRTTRYRNGTVIPNVTEDDQWTTSIDAWCNYENNQGYDATYGKLYNWYTASNPDICPLGWHTPSDAEWMTMEASLGMPAGELSVNTDDRGSLQNVGGSMKATGTIEASTGLWWSPNRGASNESGFTGLPGGYRNHYNPVFMFDNLGEAGTWWTTTTVGSEFVWVRRLSAYSTSVFREQEGKHRGFCVRCVRD